MIYCFTVISSEDLQLLINLLCRGCRFKANAGARIRWFEGEIVTKLPMVALARTGFSSLARVLELKNKVLLSPAYMAHLQSV